MRSGRVRLHVCGTWSAAVPGPGGRGSGYLVEAGETRVLLDCGNGVLGELARHGGPGGLTAVVLTHLHHDHVADLYALALNAKYTRRRLRVIGPPGTRTLLYRWFSLFSSDPDSYVEALLLDEVAPWSETTVGTLRVTVAPVEHNVPANAVRIEGDGKVFVYSGDSKDSALLEEAAKGADLFLCEATYAEPLPPHAADAHLTGAKAGALARRAGARRLVLTHFLVTQSREKIRAEAEDAFGGSVDLAEEGRSFDV